MPNKVLDTIKSNPWETSLIGGATLLCLCIALLWLKRKEASEPARTTEDLTAEDLTAKELRELLMQYTPLPGVLIAMVQSYADTALSQQQREDIKKILRKYIPKGHNMNTTSSGGGHQERIESYLSILKAATENRFQDEMENFGEQNICRLNQTLKGIWDITPPEERPPSPKSCYIPTDYRKLGETEYLRTLFLENQYFGCRNSRGGRLISCRNAAVTGFLPEEFIQDLTSVLSGAPLPRNYEDQHNIQNRPN